MSRPAPPHFATCSTYRKHMSRGGTNNGLIGRGGMQTNNSTIEQQQQNQQGGAGTGTIPKNMLSLKCSTPRPDDLSVTSWYSNQGIRSDSNINGKESQDSLMIKNNCGDNKLTRLERTSFLTRKACMDLNDAIALLNETCPNPEPSPSLTPRTPLTPRAARNKRTRSKSSDNSSNYSNDRLSEHSLDVGTMNKSQEKEKKRPFLKKIGISMTEDRPFLAKLTPRIIGKPYLQKIGPSKAVERPFLAKIGSSKTMEKFIFDILPRTPRNKDQQASLEECVDKQLISIPPVVPESSDEETNLTRRSLSKKRFLQKMCSFESEDILEMTIPIDEKIQPESRMFPLVDKIDGQLKSSNVAELLKCRVTTSEEIISFNLDHGSSKKSIPHRTNSAEDESSTSKNRLSIFQKDLSYSPTKRQICSSIEMSQQNVCSPSKSRKTTVEENSNVWGFNKKKQTSEEILDRKSDVPFERRGISSDNLLTKTSLSCFDDIAKSSSCKDEITGKKDNFKQLQMKFEFHQVPTESYAEFKRRTNTIFQKKHGILLRKSMSKLPSVNICLDVKPEEEKDKARTENQKISTRSVLKKQERIDLQLDEYESSVATKPKGQITHEPSQETMDLLTELRRVKSLLNTPSWDSTHTDDEEGKPQRFPKRVLLTDVEFCLSVDCENQTDMVGIKDHSNDQSETSESIRTSGLASFEKKYFSLDYTNDENPKVTPASTTASLTSGDMRFICSSESVKSTSGKKSREDSAECEKAKDKKDISHKKSQNSQSEVDLDRKDFTIRKNMLEKNVERTSDLYEIISPKSTPFRGKKRFGKISVEESVVKTESFDLNSKITEQCSSSVVIGKRTKCFPL